MRLQFLEASGTQLEQKFLSIPVIAIMKRSQELKSNIRKQDTKIRRYDFWNKLILPVDYSAEAPKKLFIEFLQPIHNFLEKGLLVESFKAEDFKTYPKSSTYPKLYLPLPRKLLLNQWTDQTKSTQKPLEITVQTTTDFFKALTSSNSLQTKFVWSPIFPKPGRWSIQLSSRRRVFF